MGSIVKCCVYGGPALLYFISALWIDTYQTTEDFLLENTHNIVLSTHTVTHIILHFPVPAAISVACFCHLAC